MYQSAHSQGVTEDLHQSARGKTQSSTCEKDRIVCWKNLHVCPVHEVVCHYVCASSVPSAHRTSDTNKRRVEIRQRINKWHQPIFSQHCIIVESEKKICTVRESRRSCDVEGWTGLVRIVAEHHQTKFRYYAKRLRSLCSSVHAEPKHRPCIAAYRQWYGNPLMEKYSDVIRVHAKKWVIVVDRENHPILKGC